MNTNETTQGPKQPKVNGITFNDWFRGEAGYLRKVFNILSAAIPTGVLFTFFSPEQFNLKGIEIDKALAPSLALQFVFIGYLVWRFISHARKDGDAYKWRKVPELLKKDTINLKKFLRSLNFKTDTFVLETEEQREEKADQLKKNINEALANEGRFKNAWTSVWIIWLLIYVVKGLYVFGIPVSHHDDRGQLFLSNMYSFLVCLQIIAFAVCYFLLSNSDLKKKTGINNSLWVYILVLVVAVVFIVLTTFDSFDNFSETSTMTMIFLMKILRNTLLSTFFALMVSKLLSDDLDSPSWLKISLFYYVCTIPLFVIFSDMPELKKELSRGIGSNIVKIMNYVEVILYNLAWIFKFCLFLFVTWLVEEDHLVFYFLRFRGSVHEVKKDRKTVNDILNLVEPKPEE